MDDRSETGSLVDTINRLRHDEPTPPVPALIPYPKDDHIAPTEGNDALEKIANAEARRESKRRESIQISPLSKRRTPKDPLLATPRRSSSYRPRPARTPSLASVNEDVILRDIDWSVVPCKDAGTQTTVCGYHLEAL